MCRRRREFIIYETKAGISQGGACSYRNYFCMIRRILSVRLVSRVQWSFEAFWLLNSTSRACLLSHATDYILRQRNVLFQSSLKCHLMCVLLPENKRVDLFTVGEEEKLIESKLIQRGVKSLWKNELKVLHASFVFANENKKFVSHFSLIIIFSYLPLKISLTSKFPFFSMNFPSYSLNFPSFSWISPIHLFFLNFPFSPIFSWVFPEFLL